MTVRKLRRSCDIAVAMTTWWMLATMLCATVGVTRADNPCKAPPWALQWNTTRGDMATVTWSVEPNVSSTHSLSLYIYIHQHQHKLTNTLVHRHRLLNTYTPTNLCKPTRAPDCWMCADTTSCEYLYSICSKWRSEDRTCWWWWDKMDDSCLTALEDLRGPIRSLRLNGQFTKCMLASRRSIFVSIKWLQSSQCSKYGWRPSIRQGFYIFMTLTNKKCE